MSLRIYNSLSREKELFVPLQKDRVSMYVCGPTVYDHAHIGHAKSYISFDVIVRYLRFLGYKVRYVQNITDVGHMLDDGEDRILHGAKREHVEPMELVENYMRGYFEDMDALNVIRPNISPRACGHIPEQIELVKILINKGYAYEVNGSVYFDVRKFDGYGKLSRRKIDDQQAGARVEVNPEKKFPADFALWKRAEPEHIMRWNSPWGWGFPGWHIECSAMSAKYLGESFDIHGGGIENIFPHHESEIAQSEAATGKPFAKYWLHNNMVLADGVKMSKSLGNSVTIQDALKQYTPEQIRFFILTSHYRNPVDFSSKAMESAKQGLDRLFGILATLSSMEKNAPEGNLDQRMAVTLEAGRRQFKEAMDDDFNTAAAIAAFRAFIFVEKVRGSRPKNVLSTCR
jgi:cysteinyl-tRNA synthetase